MNFLLKNKTTEKRYKNKGIDSARKLAILTHFEKNINIANNPLLEVDEIDLKDSLSQFVLNAGNKIPFPAPENPKFTFIDLFAGVGGFRIALQSLGGKCLYSSEFEKYAQKTYFSNFGEVPFGDISDDTIKSFIPDKFDILCAGFPCQPFSIAGYRQGFSDSRGTLFFEIETIVENHRPKIIFLENVKNLVSHDKGNTFKVMLDILENKLKYKVFYKVLNPMLYANIPQNRERIFIIAFDTEVNSLDPSSFEFPKEEELMLNVQDIISKEKQEDKYYYKKEHKYYEILNKSIQNTDTIYQWRRVYLRENKSNVCPTLTANMGTGGHNVPIIRDNFGIRKLTPKECFLFQGFPDNFLLPKIPDSKLYTQVGNSVTIPLIKKIAKQFLKVLYD